MNSKGNIAGTGYYFILGLILSACSGAVGKHSNIGTDSQTSIALSRSTENANFIQTESISPQQLALDSTSVSPPSIKYGYTGKRLDPESEQNDYDARSYASRQMHFTTPDSIVPNTMDPQSFNRYAYVKNNPMNYVDPNGHEQIPSSVWHDNSKLTQYLTSRFSDVVGANKEATALFQNFLKGGGDLASLGLDLSEIKSDGDLVASVIGKLSANSSNVLNGISHEADVAGKIVNDIRAGRGTASLSPNYLKNLAERSANAAIQISEDQASFPFQTGPTLSGGNTKFIGPSPAAGRISRFAHAISENSVLNKIFTGTLEAFHGLSKGANAIAPVFTAVDMAKGVTNPLAVLSAYQNKLESRGFLGRLTATVTDYWGVQTATFALGSAGFSPAVTPSGVVGIGPNGQIVTAADSWPPFN